MSGFFTLCKYEFKKHTPIRRKKKAEVLGSVFSLAFTLLLMAALIVLLADISNNYVALKIDKIKDPMARAQELVNLYYTAIIVAMSLLCVDKMRQVLTEQKDRALLLRFPVKPQTIFLSKLLLLLVWNYAVGFCLVVPVNVIVYAALQPTATYWLTSALVCLLLPIIPFLIATILIVPYIKLVWFIKNKYALLFLSYSGLLIGAFWVYSGFLSIVQSLLETGSIKFLFNANFIRFLQSLSAYTYPANSFACILLNVNFLPSLFIVLAFALVAVFVVYFVTKKLFFITLYKNDEMRKTGKKKEKYRKLSPTLSLLKKEFICVCRQPRHLFSYFSIATAMPVMAYCCYTLFESLIENALGVSVHFSLAIMIVLVFSVLTNTFCSTNITREGVAALKMKIFPVSPTKILLSKVLFCGLVSSLSVVLSVALLVAATSLTITDGIVCCGLGVLFSLAQIFVATRMDLNHAKISSTQAEAKRENGKTVAKVVMVGLLLSLAMGIFSTVVSIFSGNASMGGATVHELFTYMIPAAGCVAYFLASLFYYRYKIKKSFENMVA